MKDPVKIVTHNKAASALGLKYQLLFAKVIRSKIVFQTKS